MTRGSNPSLLILEMEGRERLFHRGVLPVLKRVDGTSCSTWGPPWLPKCGTLCQAGSEGSGKWCQDLLNYEQSGHFDGVQPQRNTRQRPRPNCAGTSHVRDTTDLRNVPRENMDPRASAGGWRCGCTCAGDPHQQDAEGRALIRALRSDLGSALKKDTEGAQSKDTGRT